MTRLLISGGPGSGCTSTAASVGARLELAVLDSDAFFHKPTDPPFQAQYSPEERRSLLAAATSIRGGWVLSGSVATWGVPNLAPTHTVFLHCPKEVRLERLLRRQQAKFGPRLKVGGDMHEEHQLFMEWAAGYEERTEAERNLTTDRAFLQALGVPFFECVQVEPLEDVVTRILRFVSAS